MTREPFDLAILGGTVVTELGTTKLNIGVRGGVIAKVSNAPIAGIETLDASGRLVLPGGVDSHVHVEQRGNIVHAGGETFESCSASAALGGTTTMICFARQVRGEGIRISVEDYALRAARSSIDVAFHLTITELSAQVHKELPGLIAEGHRSIKIFMNTERSYLEDDAILKVMQLAREHGALVCLHAENFHASQWGTRRLVAQGESAPVFAALAKPIAIEREAVHRAAMLAELTGCPIQVFHVSGLEPLTEVERARARGTSISAETCPQYLLFTVADLHTDMPQSVRYIFGPPPRTSEDKEALWQGLRDGRLNIVSSDHSPHQLYGEAGKLHIAETKGFSAIPHGIPGIGSRLSLLFSEGVTKSRISLERFVQLTATNPAKAFGLYPRKGAIRVGADADLVFWDPNASFEIRNETLGHNVDYTPYEGYRGTGLPVLTLRRGKPLARDGKLLTQGGGALLLRPALTQDTNILH